MRNALKQLFFKAEDLLDAGSTAKAVKAYQLALEEAKKDDSEEFHARTYLGMAFNEADNPKKAIECFRRCQDLAAKLYGLNSKEYATSLSNEGMVYSHRGEIAPAETLLEEAAKILQAITKGAKPSSKEVSESAFCVPIEVYANVADCKAKLGKSAEALKWMKSSYAEAKSLLPDGHPTRVQIAMELSTLLAAAGKDKEATKLAEDTFFAMMGPETTALDALKIFSDAMVNSAAMLDGLASTPAQAAAKPKSTTKVQAPTKLQSATKLQTASKASQTKSSTASHMASNLASRTASSKTKVTDLVPKKPTMTAVTVSGPKKTTNTKVTAASSKAVSPPVVSNVVPIGSKSNKR